MEKFAFCIPHRTNVNVNINEDVLKTDNFIIGFNFS